MIFLLVDIRYILCQLAKPCPKHSDSIWTFHDNVCSFRFSVFFVQQWLKLFRFTTTMLIV